MDQSNIIIETSLKESLKRQIDILRGRLNQAEDRDTIYALEKYYSLENIFGSILESQEKIKDLRYEIANFDSEFVKSHESKIQELYESLKNTELWQRFYSEPKPDRKPMPIDDFMGVVKTSIPALMNRYFTNETYPGQKTVSDREDLQGFKSMVVDEAFIIAKMVAKKYGDISEKTLIGETW